MTPTLEPTLKVLLPHLASPLASPQACTAMQRLARWLAPMPRGLFECRLDRNACQIDLSQGIVANPHECTTLLHHIATISREYDVLARTAWEHVRDFCLQWTEASSPLCDGVLNIWLEFDLHTPAPRAPVPAVFVALKHEGVEAQEAFASAETALKILRRQPMPLALQRNLEGCFAACPAAAAVNHIGVMLSRPSEAIRVNVTRLSPDQIGMFLKQVDWQGPGDELASLAARLGSFVDSIVLCLDVGIRVYPKIGLECFIDRQPEEESRWRRFLCHLVACRLCTPEKRDALLAWPGGTYPPDTSEPWPGHLMVTSLWQARHVFSVFHRRLNHIKIDYQPAGQLRAKAYLSFTHTWVRGTPDAG